MSGTQKQFSRMTTIEKNKNRNKQAVVEGRKEGRLRGGCGLAIRWKTRQEAAEQEGQLEQEMRRAREKEMSDSDFWETIKVNQYFYYNYYF